MNDKIQKVISLYNASYDSLKGVFVYMNLEPIDTDFTAIMYYDEVFHFEFSDDNIEDFQFYIGDIKEITFDTISGVTISIIELIAGDTIMIFNL